MCKSIRFCLASLFVLAFFALSAMAQGTVTGSVNGTVMNPNKEVVPGATITVKNTGTNKEVNATSDDSGGFKVVNLEPGNYTVTVNATGFAPFTKENVVVEVGRSTPLEVGLGLQAVSGEVSVTAEAPVINNTSQDFSSNINQTTINEAPINGRRWSNFAILTPGAVPDGTFGLISFRGISGLLNNNTVDGGDNNQAFFAEERGRTRIPYVISQASIREFQVNTSTYSAEYGRSAGGVTNAVTKSGTNELHGSAFLYDRNNKWGTRNPLATNSVLINGVFQPVGIKPKDVRYQFGGTVGGPIVKDKAFFFFSYDQQRRDFPGLSRFTDPNVLNTANRTALLARGLTTTQIDSTLAFLNSITGPLPRRGDNLIFLPKVDWHINDKNVFTATYNWLKWDSPAGIQTQATNTRARDNFGDDFVRARFLNLRLASTLTGNLVNEARGQWGRDFEYEFSQPPLPGEPTNSIGGRSPQTFFNNGLSFGIPEFLERPAFPDEKRVQFADTVTYTSGNHTYKFGGDINHVTDIISNLRFSGGEFNYTGANGLNDFIVDYTNFTTSGAIRALVPTAGSPNLGVCIGSTRRAGKCYGGNFNQGFGVLGLTMHTTDYNLFMQDDWRITPRLTLNLGLRYEFQRNPSARFVNAALPQTANKVSDKNNFGPRLGFAWDVNGDGKTAVRGGYGVYYGRVINSTVYNALINTGVGIDVAQRQFSITGTSTSSLCPAPLTADTCSFLPIYPNLLSASNPPPGAVQYFANGFQLPRIHQIDAVLEREIARNTVVSASYLFSYGQFLPNFVDTNLPPPNRLASVTAVGGPFNGQVWTFPLFTGPRPNPAFVQITEIRSNVFSKYNAMVLQFNRRMTNGLQVQSSYTLSRAYDNGQSSVTFTSNNLPFNAFDQAGENGLSAFDRRHKFVFSLVYNTHYKNKDNAFGRALFNGWTIAPILNWFSGQRYTGTVNSVSPINNLGFTGTSCTIGLVSNTACSTPGGGVNGSGGSTRFSLVPRSFFKQPPIQYLDLRISRRFSLGEKAKIEVLGEAFNFFNRTQVTTVNTSLYSFRSCTFNPATNPAATPCPFIDFNPSFGQTTGADSTLFRERQVQLAVRFEF